MKALHPQFSESEITIPQLSKTAMRRLRHLFMKGMKYHDLVDVREAPQEL